MQDKVHHTGGAYSPGTACRCPDPALTLAVAAVRACTPGGMMGTAATWSSTMRLTAEPVSVSRERRFVRLRLGEHMPAYPADEVELVVSELVTNALRYAQPPFRVRLRAFDQTLRVEVEDGTQAPPVRVVARIFAVRGRGIALVNVLSRDWGVITRTPSGKSVWAEFDVR